MFLPVFVAGGSALLSFYIMQAKMEVALAKERESLAEARAAITTQKVTMEERIKVTMEERIKATDMAFGSLFGPDEFVQEIRVKSVRDNRLPTRPERFGTALWPHPVQEIPPWTVPASPDYVLPNFWRAVHRHKIAILVTGLISLLLAAGVTRLQTPKYRAQVLMDLRDPAAGLAPFRAAGGGVDLTGDAAIQTNVAILGSAPLVKRVVERLKLDQLPAFIGPSDTSAWLRRMLRSPQLPEEPPADRALENALQNLSVRHTAGVVEITYTSEDPLLAADFVNTLADEHLRRGREADSAAMQRLNERLSAETADLQRQLERSEAELQRYSRGTGLLSTSDRDASAAEQRLRLLGEELARAQADRIVKESRQQLAASSRPDWLPQTTDDPTLRDYQTKLTDLRREAAQLESLLTPENYKVQRVQNEIAVLQAAHDSELASLRKRVENDYTSAVGQEKMLAQRYARQAEQVSEEAAQSVHYNTLKRELETVRTLRAEILEKGEQLSLAAATPVAGLRIIDRASPPTRPYRPNYPLNLSLGLFEGILAGVVLAMVREHRRPTLRAPGEALSLLHLPEFGAIPRAEGNTLSVPRHRPELAAWKPQPSPLIESIHDALASLASRCEGGPSVILFTSPAPGDGKTTIIANLAIALAQCQRRVLLIDGDLKRPRLHKLFGVSMRPGFSDLLQDSLFGELQADPMIENPLSIPNLHLLPSGPTVVPSAPLLSGGRLPRLVARFRSAYDIVLVDAPPVLQGPDARLLGRLADGVILVVRSRKTTHQDAVAALQRLMTDRIPVAGTILNDWNPRSDSASYHYEPYQAYATAGDEKD
jgi:succinoglycan biosynthesis transport protein ExoP